MCLARTVLSLPPAPRCSGGLGRGKLPAKLFLRARRLFECSVSFMPQAGGDVKILHRI